MSDVVRRSDGRKRLHMSERHIEGGAGRNFFARRTLMKRHWLHVLRLRKDTMHSAA